MSSWLDAQLSPAMASWITREFSVSAIAVRDLGLRNAKDRNPLLEKTLNNVFPISPNLDLAPQNVWP
jgi:predicted nuclease of predicted toxin-antitoxin system